MEAINDPAKELKSSILVALGTVLLPRREHLKLTLPFLLEGYLNAIETGRQEYAAYCLVGYSFNLYFTGKNLEEIEKEIYCYYQTIINLNQKPMIIAEAIYLQVVLNLRSQSKQPWDLLGNAYNEQTINNIYPILIYHFHINKMFLYYLFEKDREALDSVSLLEEHSNIASGTGAITFIMFYLYSSLVYLKLSDRFPSEQAQEWLTKVEANQEKMKIWAHYAPMNYQHKYDLVAAEKARVLGKTLEAMDYYDRAIAGAAENEYTQEEALACELAAEFYQSLGKQIIADAYLIKAYQAYSRWGAIAKLKHLEAKYPQLAKPTLTVTNSQTAPVETAAVTSAALDLSTTIKASQALSSEIVFSNLLAKLLQLAMENAGAQRAVFIIQENEQLFVEAEKTLEVETFTQTPAVLLEASDDLPITLISYAARLRQPVVLDNASVDANFGQDPYIVSAQPLSILCLPILHQGKLNGILYLENNIAASAFTPDRLKLLELLAAQAAISLENARFYETLEQRVQQRTEELRAALAELKQTQVQLIQSERMSSLGQMVGGLAHEINNPISFIYGNITEAGKHIDNLVKIIEHYQKISLKQTPETAELLAECELDYIQEDLPKILASMRKGADRIRGIVLSLRQFVRLDESPQKFVHMHEQIESTLIVLESRLRAIDIIREYDNLPEINCYPAELNQVFWHLLVNAIEAIAASPAKQAGQIRIRTSKVGEQRIGIEIADNGNGIPPEIQDRIFDPFFTTKLATKNPGLGLSLSYQIVTQRHGGTLECNSVAGEGASFIVQIPVDAKLNGSNHLNA